MDAFVEVVAREEPRYASAYEAASAILKASSSVSLFGGGGRGGETNAGDGTP